MKIVIAGGSGQLGHILCSELGTAGGFASEIVRLRRKPPGGLPAASSMDVLWDGRTLGDWIHTLDGADVVINLAGRSVNCRYTAANRDQIRQSRVDSTRVLAEAIQQVANPPRVWLQASTATIYAHRYDAPNDEHTGIIGGAEPGVPSSWRFSIDVARVWEETLAEADTPNTRKVALRSAMVMSPDPGGIFDVLVGLVRKGLGGPAGDGRQYVSWIHGTDFVRAVRFLIDRDDIAGPVNLASPAPSPNAAFMRALRDAASVRIGLPATRWMLEIGAWFMRTETELVLKSRRVVPGRLLAHGFTFDHPEWPAAARELYPRWRTARHARTPGSR